MFNWFKKEPPVMETKVVPVQGQPVILNAENKTPEFRLSRAANRVHNLKRKLFKLESGRLKGDPQRIAEVIAQTKQAIGEWEKKVRIYEFELSVERGAPINKEENE